MMDYVDVTPLVNPIVTWAHIAPYEPQTNTPRQASLLQTHSARSQVNPFDLFVSGSGALAPTSIVEDRVERFAKERETARETLIYSPQWGASGPKREAGPKNVSVL
jgi:hypothetical protein